MPELRFKLNHHLYLKDPQETEFGHKLLAHSTELMQEIGFEQFTFRKLAERMNSVEASIYRYFENKHKLLLFLINWYSEWTHYSIRMYILTVDDRKKRLDLALENIIHSKLISDQEQYINTELLRQIVIEQSSKSYHIHDVDQENQLGLFFSYKKLNLLLTELIKDYNNNFPYPSSLASTIIEMVNQQLYFADHLPMFTELKSNESNEKALEDMIKFFVYRLID